MGRPKKITKPQREIHIRIDEDVAEKIAKKAARVGRPMSEELRRVLSRAYA